MAFAAYGTAVLPPEGNGFIAVFVAAIAFGIWRPDIRECFETRSEDLLEVVTLGVFLVFGAIFTFDPRPPIISRTIAHPISITTNSKLFCLDHIRIAY